jgi:hypothetical protein
VAAATAPVARAVTDFLSITAAPDCEGSGKLTVLLASMERLSSW